MVMSSPASGFSEALKRAKMKSCRSGACVKSPALTGCVRLRSSKAVTLLPVPRILTVWAPKVVVVTASGPRGPVMAGLMVMGRKPPWVLAGVFAAGAR
jgi:hypothetical protein